MVSGLIFGFLRNSSHIADGNRDCRGERRRERRGDGNRDCRGERRGDRIRDGIRDGNRDCRGERNRDGNRERRGDGNSDSWIDNSSMISRTSVITFPIKLLPGHLDGLETSG